MRKVSILSLLMLLIMVGMVSAVPLSIIDSSYVSFERDIQGPVWSVQVRGDSSADYLVFADNTEITGVADGETVQAANDFQLSSSIEQESCIYSLRDSSREDIYKYEIKEIGSNIFVSNWDKYIDQCYDDGGLLAWGSGSLLVTKDINCLFGTKIATAGVVDEGKIDFNAQFSLKQGSDVITKSISTLASSADGIPSKVSFESNGKTVATVNWIGGSTFGEFCPGQDEVVAMEYGNKWYTSDKDLYTLYNDQYSLLIEQISRYKDGGVKIRTAERQELDRLIGAVNARGIAALQEVPIQSGTLTSQMSGSTAIINLPRDQLIYAPDFQILVSTDWLKLVYLTSRPTIVDSSFGTCQEGSADNQITTVVKNDGLSRSKFLVSAVCSEGLSLDATQRSVTLSPGEEETVSFPFTLDLTNDERINCVITAEDNINSDAKDTDKVSSNCEVNRVCEIEGVVQCFGQVEKACTGGQWIETGSANCLSDVCDRDSKCEEGESFELCGGKSASENDCATCDLDGFCDATETIYSCPNDCGNDPNNIPTWVYVIGGSLLAILVYFGITSIKPAPGSKKTKRGKYKAPKKKSKNKSFVRK